MNVWPILAAKYTFSAGFPIHSLDSASFHFAFSRTRSLDTYPLLQFGWKVIYVMNLSKVPSLCFIDRRHKRCYNHFYGACRSLRNFKSTPRVAYLGSNGRLRTHIVVGRLFGEGGLWICPAGRMGEMGGRNGKKVVWANPQDARSISMLLTTFWWKVRQMTTIDQHYRGL